MHSVLPRQVLEPNGQAVVIGIVSLDSLLTSLAADNATRTYHDSDKELVGQGVGNVVAGLAGGLACAGATIRTLTNINARERTALSGVVHSLVLLEHRSVLESAA